MRTREHLNLLKRGSKLIIPTLEYINALQDSNLHFDIMNIKFYLLSQELGDLLFCSYLLFKLKLGPPTAHLT